MQHHEHLQLKLKAMCSPLSEEQSGAGNQSIAKRLIRINLEKKQKKENDKNNPLIKHHCVENKYVWWF